MTAKKCPDCGDNMVLLWSSSYCPSCEDKVEREDPWDIEFTSALTCAHPTEHHYLLDDHPFCRACGSRL